MKKEFISILLLTGLILTLIISSCKKDDVNNSISIVGNWKMTAYIHNDIDVYGTAVPPCVIDNIITFSNTNIATADEGLTKCNSTDPQILAGTYSINSDQTQLSLTYNGSTETDSILTLNSTTLKLKQLSNNDVITYTRQQ